MSFNDFKKRFEEMGDRTIVGLANFALHYGAPAVLSEDQEKFFVNELDVSSTRLGGESRKVHNNYLLWTKAYWNGSSDDFVKLLKSDEVAALKIVERFTQFKDKKEFSDRIASLRGGLSKGDEVLIYERLKKKGMKKSYPVILKTDVAELEKRLEEELGDRVEKQVEEIAEEFEELGEAKLAKEKEKEVVVLPKKSPMRERAAELGTELQERVERTQKLFGIEAAQAKTVAKERWLEAKGRWEQRTPTPKEAKGFLPKTPIRKEESDFQNLRAELQAISLSPAGSSFLSRLKELDKSLYQNGFLQPYKFDTLDAYEKRHKGNPRIAMGTVVGKYKKFNHVMKRRGSITKEQKKKFVDLRAELKKLGDTPEGIEYFEGPLQDQDPGLYGKGYFHAGLDARISYDDFILLNGYDSLPAMEKVLKKYREHIKEKAARASGNG